MNKREKITEIINSVSGADVEKNRIAALEAAGFTVKFVGRKPTWGQAGTIKEHEEVLGFLVQLAAKDKKRGCTVYNVSWPNAF